jgi:hypothetical protein
MSLWYVQGDVAYYRLSACSGVGYFAESFLERDGDCQLGVGWTKRPDDARTWTTTTSSCPIASESW